MQETLRQVEYPCTGSRVHFAIPWKYQTPDDVLVIVREPKGQREHALLHGHDFTLAGPMICLAKPPPYNARVLVLFQGDVVQAAPARPVVAEGAISAPVEPDPAPRVRPAARSVPRPEPAPVPMPVIYEPDDYDEENDPVLREDVAKLAQLTERVAQQQAGAAELSQRQMKELRQWQSGIEDRLARLEAVLAILGDNAKQLLEADQ